MREDRFEVIAGALLELAPDGCSSFAPQVRETFGAVSSAISVEVQAFEVVGGERSQSGMEFIVARGGREGPVVSVKPANISREVSRTVQAAALFALLEVSVLSQPAPVRVLTALAGFLFAAYNATRATIGYSEACVLHRAWKLAGERADRKFTLAEIRAGKDEMVREYVAPKLVSDTEIDDAIENLCGLKSIRRDGAGFILMERIIFFNDGNIRN
jgi:hypothetical protein